MAEQRQEEEGTRAFDPRLAQQLLTYLRPYRARATASVGRLMTRVTTDVDALNEMFTAGFVSIFGDIVVLLGIVLVLFWMNWRMALVLFSITPFIVLVSMWFRRGARDTYRQVRARIAAINAFLQERISGMSTVQLFNREAREAEKFDQLNARHRDANIDSIFYYAVFYPVIELI